MWVKNLTYILRVYIYIYYIIDAGLIDSINGMDSIDNTGMMLKIN